MSRLSLTRMVAMNLRRNARSLLLSSLGIVVGIGSFVFFVALGGGVKKVVTRDMLGALPVHQMEVVPKTYSLGMFKVRQASFLGGRLSPSAVRRFRLLPEVEEVFPKMNLKVPSRAVIPIPKVFQKKGLASAFYTELVVQGIDPRAIPAEDPGKEEFHYKKKGPIPVLISRRLLELYNATLADLKGFPKLTARAVSMISFTLVVGSSVFRRKNHPKGVRRFRCRVVGVSSRAILVGISIPLKHVIQWNRIYQGPRAGAEYRSVILSARSAADVPVMAKKIEKMGFALETGQVMARKVGDIISLITILFTLISAVIMVIAAIGITHTFFMSVYERRQGIGLLRAVGASRAVIRWLVLAEAAVVGLCSGAVGAGLGFLLARLSDWGIGRLENIPFRPDTFFLFPLWLIPSAVGFAVLFCVLGAFFPSRRAASLDPARVLSGH